MGILFWFESRRPAELDEDATLAGLSRPEAI